MRIRHALALAALTTLAAACGSSSNEPAVQPPTGLTYPHATLVFQVGVAIGAEQPTYGGGDVDTWSVSPALPAGVLLHATTGIVYGTPTAASPATTYTVTAANAGGHATAELSITVQAASTAQVTVNTPTATMNPGETRVFSAAVVTGAEDASVTWSTSPADAGTLTARDASSIVFTAPSPAGGGQVQLIATSVADPTATATVTITVRAAAVVADVIFNNGNIGGVDSSAAVPSAATRFELLVGRHLTYFDSYHYFNNGILPGQLSLRHDDGTVYGPWQTTGIPGQGNVSNAYWICYPEVDLKAGWYTVIDSDPATWSFNGESGGAGFVKLMASPLDG